MYTNPDGQFTAIIRRGLFSIYKISGLKNDQLSISKILGNCLKQTTDLTRQKLKMETVLF